jgi:hypothetical protein
MSKTSTRRPGRDEIVDLFRACAAKNDGRAPGKNLLQKLGASPKLRSNPTSGKVGVLSLRRGGT